MPFVTFYKCHRLQGPSLVTVPLVLISYNSEIYQGGEHRAPTNDGRIDSSESIQALDG